MKKFRLLILLITIALLASCSQPEAQSTPTERILVVTETSEPAQPSSEPTDSPIQAEETATQTEPAATKPAPTQTEEPPTFEPTFEMDSCPFELPEGVVEGDDVICGFVVVPEDHQKPEGPTIRLALVQVKDKSFPHQPDPVILLAGGPGEKTVENALSLAPVLAPLHPNRDLIFFDQRGVGLSQPALECPQWEQTYFDLLDEPDPQVAQKTNFAALMDCRDQLMAEGYNLSAYNTIQNAADVEAIRIALDYDQVNLYGGSYGTHLAQAVLRDHPQGIRSAVLSSVYPLEKSLFVDGASSTANAVLHLMDTCKADQDCSQAYPDLQDVLFEVIDRLNAEPITIVVTHPYSRQTYDAILTGDGVFDNLVALLYQTQIIPILPQAIYDVYNGDYELMTQLRSINLLFIEALSRGMEFSVVCTDDLIGKTPQDLLNVRAQLPRELAGATDPEDIIEYGIFGICENWPVEQAEAWVKQPVLSDIPTLVLEGEFDPVTPPEHGRLVAEHLSNGYYFEFPGIGHDITVASECARKIAGDFVDNPNQSPDGSCIDEMSGVVFDVPGEVEELVLEPFTDVARGFSGLVPVGWEELALANMMRRNNALDPTYFILEAIRGTAEELYNALMPQFGLEDDPEPVAETEVGNFTWTVYTFELRGNMVDLALAEDELKAYFVLLISTQDEHDTLNEQLFMPALEAMKPLD